MKESTRKDEKEGRRDIGIRRIIVAGSRTMAREEQRRRKERKERKKERKKKRGLFGLCDKKIFFFKFPLLRARAPHPLIIPHFSHSGTLVWRPKRVFFGGSLIRKISFLVCQDSRTSKTGKKKKKRKKERGRGEQEEG